MAISISFHCLGFIVLAAVFIQTITVVVSMMYLNNVLNTMRRSFSHSSMSCLMDANLRSAPGLEDPEDEAKKSDPCWQLTQQLHYRIEKVKEKNRLTGGLPALSPTGVRRVVAAHVTGVPCSSQPEVSRGSRGYLGERVGPWEGHRGLAFLQNMELGGWDLLVPRAGLYFIYSQTYFRLPSVGEAAGEARQLEDAQLVQYIYKKMSSYTVPILLMKSSRSVCWPRGPEPGLFSLHQAGTAHLQPADRLFITVSNVSTVVMDGRTSYFGAFLVG
uniref:Tumor necrosis factor ligand superfamily member 10 n=1 Tax=Gadus morhua TaxID=8049 RepID=A0A8C5CQA1_GADMO